MSCTKGRTATYIKTKAWTLLALEIQNSQKFYLKAHGQNCEGKTFMHLKFVPKYAPTIPALRGRPAGPGVRPRQKSKHCLAYILRHTPTRAYQGLGRAVTQNIYNAREGDRPTEAALPLHAKGRTKAAKAPTETQTKPRRSSRPQPRSHARNKIFSRNAL